MFVQEGPPIEDSLLHLQVDTDQATVPRNGSSQKARLVFGLVALMFTGTVVWATLSHDSQAHSTSKPSHYTQAVGGFNPGVGTRVGLRNQLEVTRDTYVPVAPSQAGVQFPGFAPRQEQPGRMRRTEAGVRTAGPKPAQLPVSRLALIAMTASQQSEATAPEVNQTLRMRSTRLLMKSITAVDEVNKALEQALSEAASNADVEEIERLLALDRPALRAAAVKGQLEEVDRLLGKKLNDEVEKMSDAAQKIEKKSTSETQTESGQKTSEVADKMKLEEAAEKLEKKSASETQSESGQKTSEAPVEPMWYDNFEKRSVSEPQDWGGPAYPDDLSDDDRRRFEAAGAFAFLLRKENKAASEKQAKKSTPLPDLVTRKIQELFKLDREDP